MSRSILFITSPARTPESIQLPIIERCDEFIDLLLIRTFAPGVDARTGCVADPQHNLVWSRRVMDQHRCRIEGIEIPTLVEGSIDDTNSTSE